MDEKSLLWVGDAGCPSGFAIATHQILATLRHHYKVGVLGINYLGDPHEYPYPIWAAAVHGDAFGVGRLIWMCDTVKPDVIVLQNDGWNIPFYVNQLRQRLPNGTFRFPEYAEVPIVAIVAVDGKNFDGDWLKGVDLAIFWTQFALDEAREGGYRGPAKVIPLGVNLDTFKPLDRAEMRLKKFGADVIPPNAFIVGNVNRNQPRKRWDLTLRYFAKWIEDKNVNNAWLFLHAAPTGEMTIDVVALARHYSILDRCVLVQPPAFYGVPEDDMCATYNCLDVLISTTQGEGMGLPAMEAMACGVPCELPDSSAYSDWARDAALLVPCTSTSSCTPPYKNVIGAIPDEREFIDTLDLLYRDTTFRMHTAAQGMRRVREERFRWAHIGQQYVDALATLVREPEDAKADKSAVDEQKHQERVEHRLQILRGEVTA